MLSDDYSLCHPAKNAPLCYRAKQNLIRVFVRSLMQILKKTAFFLRGSTRPRTNSRVFSTFFSQYVDENFAGRQSGEKAHGHVKKILCISLLLFSTLASSMPEKILPGAEQTSRYLPLLKNKRVGVFVNQTSRVGQKHLLDVLRANGIQVTEIFVPEHGFRGVADAGDQIKNSIDIPTGIPIISLYGKKLRPSTEDLQNVDVLLFDIQDVGVRFYTYISSLQKLMEAAIDNNKPLIILDRPNPNGFYVDGPVLDAKYKSFTGMQPIPIVYGMTMGEYAKMLVGEQWLDVTPKTKAHDLQMTVIPCAHYTHKSLYEPPIPPSPNLPNIKSIYLYPSIGLMEATVLSVGRGTTKPFQVFGHPTIQTAFTFIPRSRPGSLTPDYVNEVCHGFEITGNKKTILKKIAGKLQIKYLLQAYYAFPDKKHFFGNTINKAVGKNNLVNQLAANASEATIRESWEPKLSEFKTIRKKYLLYGE
jgi:uncharacterized protein YbbC (DUF1343 family)